MCSSDLRVYDWTGSAWVQAGADIDGEAANDDSGFSVALSSDGSRVAIGAILNDGNSGNSRDDRGHVRVFDFNTYSVGGLVSGLEGNGLLLNLNDTQQLAVMDNGAFEFLGLVPGDSYEVSILQQPADPPQVCTVENGTGIMGTEDVTDIIISCIRLYTVGGQVSGLIPF